MTPEAGLSFSLFLPLFLGGVLYAALLLLGAFFDSRNPKHAETARNAAFVCILAAAAYALILTVITVVSKFAVIEDFVTITVVVIVFFGALAAVLLLAEMAMGAIGRRRRRGS